MRSLRMKNMMSWNKCFANRANPLETYVLRGFAYLRTQSIINAGEVYWFSLAREEYSEMTFQILHNVV